MIYFIQDSAIGLIKIGYTNGDPTDRLRALQTGSASELVLLGTMAGDESVEKGIHSVLAEFRERGEWFRPMPALLLLLIRRHIPFFGPDGVDDLSYEIGFRDGRLFEVADQKANADFQEWKQKEAQRCASLG